MQAVAIDTSRPPADADVASAWQQVRANPAMQFDLPVFHPPEVPGWLRWLIHHAGWLGSAGTAIFWIALAAAAVAVLALGVRLARRLGRRPSPPEVAPTSWQPEAQAARALLAEADALAEAGDYAAAARLLLQRSFEDLDRHRPEILHPAATTREIGRAVALPSAARVAFLPIAAAVERSLFAGRTLVRRDWDEARAAYRAFALPEAWA